MYKSISLFIIFSALFLSSCSEDDGPADPVSETKSQLSKVYIDDELAIEIIYDAQNKVSRINYPIYSYYYVYEYAANGNVIKEMSYYDDVLSSTHVYEYNAENMPIKITTTIRYNDGLEEYQAFSYNQDKTLKEINLTTANSVDAKETFTFNNAKNVVASTWSAPGDDGEQSTFTYDNKKNPFFGLVPYQYHSEWSAAQLLSPNNIIEEEETEDDEQEYETFEYEYNADGYPTEIIYTEEDYMEVWRLEYL